MTAQIGELLLFNGELTSMASVPLYQYLHNRNDLKFVKHSTACRRGYFGQWEIKDNKLYLIKLTAFIEGEKEVDLNFLFPGQDRVFANWYSGEIRIPKGEMLEYVHMGYASIFEKDLILKFHEGVLSEEKLIDNRVEFEKRKSSEIRKDNFFLE